MTSTEEYGQRSRYSDLAGQQVDEYVGVDPGAESPDCYAAAAGLPARAAALATMAYCADAYVDHEPVTYRPDPRAFAYELVHRLGDITYEESYIVPFLRGDEPDNLEPSHHVREEFERLRAAWLRKGARKGVLRDMVILPEYQRIIGLGMPVLPLIIDSLRKNPHHWSWALTAITGENPAAGSTTLREAAERWITWYDSHTEA